MNDNPIESILRRIASVGAARRGELSEYWVERPGAGGATRRHGPYYVLQWRSAGRKHSLHVKAADAERVREETARGKTVAALLEELVEAVWAWLGAGEGKKTAARPASPASMARKRRHSPDGSTRKAAARPPKSRRP